MSRPGLRNSKTIAELFYQRVQATPECIAYEYQVGETWNAVTQQGYGDSVARAAAGFRALGLKPGDRVAMWGDTMPEWTILDLGALTAGGCIAGIYQTNTPEQAAFIMSDCQAKVLCVDTVERLELALAIRKDTPSVTQYILWSDEPYGHDDVVSMTRVLEMGKAALESGAASWKALVDAVSPDMFAVLVYTSGTTGNPKGVILSHENCVYNCRSIMEGQDFVEGVDSTIAFLPMSHVAEHTCNFFGRIYAGITAYFCPDMLKVGAVMKEKSPTMFVGVPRVYEKIHRRILSAVDQAPPNKQRLFHWALSAGRQMADFNAKKVNPGPMFRLQHSVADRLVLSKIRAQLGGKIRVLTSGAAPIDVEIIHFFRSLGIAFIEVYGLSECGGVSHANRAEAFKVGTVGRVVDGMECKIAPDGEVLLRSKSVFQGYLNCPDATGEAKDGEGWLHTGDIGEVDEEGYLRITDRKKNLLITAGGKNVAPANIEILIKREPLVSQVVVLGDAKPYLVALITLAAEIVEAEGLSDTAIDRRIAQAVEEANKHLARYEQIKRYRVLDREFSIETGEMTPTMKIKRNVVVQNHKPIVDALYNAPEEVRDAIG
ncbi:MAG: long-chain fatty acid--CoA ligase [Candidatus Hydrogenedentes bacterium]|nr:long-chain fatty acid--CoA ligase [Candidatus Hydrogenedentota bacterium]